MHQPTSQTEISPTLELLRLERLNRLLFNHYPDAVYTVNMDGTFHTVNHTVCHLLKRDRKDLLGQGYQLHIHPEHWEEALHYFRSAGEGHPQRYQTVVRSSAGESVHLDVTNFPLKVAGQIVGIFGIARNITEQKERELALLRTSQELQRQNEELELFRKMIAHDFRSPIARLLGLSKLLQKPSITQKTHDTAISALLGSAQQLDVMVRDLNQMLALRQQGDESRELCHLEELVQLCLGSLKQEISDAGASVTVQAQADLQLYTVKAFLVSILQNLLSNALKYRAQDRALQVSVTLQQQEGEAVITVADNGIGMDLEAIGPSLFKMYKRFHQEVDGKGLGLYLVKEQVRLLQGKIEVSSSPGSGAAFTVYLPIHN